MGTQACECQKEGNCHCPQLSAWRNISALEALQNCILPQGMEGTQQRVPPGWRQGRKHLGSGQGQQDISQAKDHRKLCSNEHKTLLGYTRRHGPEDTWIPDL